MQLVTRNEEEIWSIDEAEPLNCHLIEEESDRQMDANIMGPQDHNQDEQRIRGTVRTVQKRSSGTLQED